MAVFIDKDCHTLNRDISQYEVLLQLKKKIMYMFFKNGEISKILKCNPRRKKAKTFQS